MDEIACEVIFVKAYTRPGEEDSAPGIRQAVAKALEIKASKIRFEAGTYLLKSAVSITTEAMRHDAGYENAELKKECHITVMNGQNLTLEGQVNASGEPATVLSGWSGGSQNHVYLPSILWCEDCEQLTVKNITFTRQIPLASAGVITEKNDDGIVVEVFEGNHFYDGMGVYCANRFNPETKALVGESVTYGNGLKETFQAIGGNRLSLPHAGVAAKVSKGEWLSWHQGAKTDFQTYFARCNQLFFENLRTENANGFCMLTESCRNITADRIVFRPSGNRLFTGPRDAWKLFKCSGKIDINRMDVEGVRMDGQNMHSNWLFFKRKINEKCGVFYCKYTYTPIEEGSVVEFYHKTELVKGFVKECKNLGKVAGGYEYGITFEGGIPEFVDEGTLCAAVCWEPELYLCRNSFFKNIAGAGHLIRYDNVIIQNCKYENTMNPGILMGAELPVHTEGGHATNIIIKDCHFDNCGFFPRYGAKGCIGIKSAGFDGPYNHDIVVMNNLFENAEIGIHALDSKAVYCINNRFHQIQKPVEEGDFAGKTVLL